MAVELRTLTVKPRRRGYKHRPIIAVRDGIGVTEHGEVVQNLPLFARSNDSHIWVTLNSARLLDVMMQAFADDECFNYQVMNSSEQVSDGRAVIANVRFTRFGFTNGRDKQSRGRRRAHHLVWDIPNMMRNARKILPGSEYGDLLAFARDVREWCKDNDVPIPTGLSGIASSLLRDPRFFTEARGRVPRATNERVRRFLPGIYSELRGEHLRTYQAVSLDQRTAYHRAAQTTPLPDPTTLFARGFFHDPDNAPIWTRPGRPVYERTIRQPGLIAVRAVSRPTHKNECRPPALNFSGERLVYLWTCELPFAIETGLQIRGLVAAWTSIRADAGLRAYGEWAEAEIAGADPTRKLWLKPTLHAAYGMLAARPRSLRIGYRQGKGPARKYVLAGLEIPVREAVNLTQTPATANVTTLGVLQAEIRLRSMRMANNLTAQGINVLHVHADGIHVAGQLPFIPDEWRMEPLTNLAYLDRVSWLSAEKDCLPGRDSRTRAHIRSQASVR